MHTVHCEYHRVYICRAVQAVAARAAFTRSGFRSHLPSVLVFARHAPHPSPPFAASHLPSHYSGNDGMSPDLPSALELPLEHGRKIVRS